MNSQTSPFPVWKRSIISGILAIHLLLVLAALAANLSSSSIQRKLLNLAQPYLKTFNWQLGLVPIELTHGNEVSDPFFIQVHYEGEPPDRWEKGPWHAVSGEARNRAGRFAQAIAFRAERAKEEIDQEDVVFQLLTSLLKSDRKQRPSSHIDRVRVIREIVYSREQLIMQMQSGENLFPPIGLHFDANVVWLSDDEVSLQQRVESRKSSKPIDKPKGKTSQCTKLRYWRRTMMLFKDIASMFRDSVIGWNRFWFESQGVKALAYTRVAVGGVALLYTLSWFPDLVSWIGPNGPLTPTSSASLMDRTGDLSVLGSIAACRPSLLFGIQSSGGIYCYLIITSISAALLMLGIGGRWIAVSTLILVLGIVHRCVGITGIAEPLLTTFLAYLVVSTGRFFTLKPGVFDSSSNGLLANIALRLMQVHMAAWLIVSFFSQQASLIWWQGEGMWYFAASKRSLILNSNSLLQSDWLTNGLTHFFILLQFIAIPSLLMEKTRSFGFVLLSLFWILIALLAGEVSYAVVGMACCLPFYPIGSRTTGLAHSAS